ncbi:SCP2 sterol-binding domain-containing protein [Pseudomonas sp.]|uniref:ubiquinone anaerobic biosynthesis accessory factor UbiT n=1 Tax=Pseudomonas sp. TaxID=306 RepID=UPI00324223C5
MKRVMAVELADRLLRLGRHVPFALQRRVIELATARLLAEPLTRGEFGLLQGHWLQLEVEDLGLSWFVTCVGRRLRVAPEAVADVRVRGNWREFVLLASREEDPDTLFFRRRLVIEGDTDMGLGLKNLLDSLDPEHLPPRLWRGLQRAGQLLQQV